MMIYIYIYNRYNFDSKTSTKSGLEHHGAWVTAKTRRLCKWVLRTVRWVSLLSPVSQVWWKTCGWLMGKWWLIDWRKLRNITPVAGFLSKCDLRAMWGLQFSHKHANVLICLKHLDTLNKTTSIYFKKSYIHAQYTYVYLYHIYT